MRLLAWALIFAFGTVLALGVYGAIVLGVD